MPLHQPSRNLANDVGAACDQISAGLKVTWFDLSVKLKVCDK